MRRTKLIVGLLAVMTALMVVSAAPAMAKGNGVNEERNETPRQQLREENHFDNFCCGNDGFVVFNGNCCFDDNFFDDDGVFDDACIGPRFGGDCIGIGPDFNTVGFFGVNPFFDDGVFFVDDGFHNGHFV